MFFKVIFFIYIIPVIAFSQGSYLNLSMYDDSEFYIVFDNITYSEPGNYTGLDGVPPGEHNLKVTLYDAAMSAMGNIVYDGKIKIPSGFDIYAVIDEYNSLIVYKRVKYGVNRCECNSDTRKKIGEKTGDNIKHNDIKFSDCNYKIMKAEDFKDLKKEINSRTFESSNISIVKTAIDKNLFSSDQLKELLGFFTFEENKLDIAKYAYKKICDKNNFYKVYDAFNFDTSIEELKNYISGK